MKDTCAIILAGGEGKRMRTSKPKVLCEVLFRPMLGWVIDFCEEAKINEICVVTGFGAKQVEEYIGSKYKTYFQSQQKGTGHAVMCAKEFLMQNKQSDVVVLYGDAPFIGSREIINSYNQHLSEGNSATIITAELNDPAAYGRIIRDSDDKVCAIVEYKDATDIQRNINEINSGTYWFKATDLLLALDQIKPNNAQGEYYITDVASIFIGQGKKVGAYVTDNSEIVLGANDRKSLLELNKIANDAVIQKHLENGVEFISTDGVVISDDAVIGGGTTIMPGTIIKQGVKIGSNSIIGPNSLIKDSEIGDNAVINASQIYESKIHNDVKIGPFCNIRPGSEIKAQAKIGDFVEIKNAVIGEGTAVSHLTYVGDSDVGKNVNFGCGCVTVNYDGVNKHRTVIQDEAFIGCNTNLVAPVNIGKGAYTGAGSTITQDVPDGALAIERAKQVNLKDYGSKKLKGKKKKFIEK